MINLIETLSDNCIGLFLIFLGIGFIIFIIDIGDSINKYNEQECVSFYKENNYILESCEIYCDKLEGINE